MSEPIIISFSGTELPLFKETRNGRLVNFGERNDYPYYLLNLFDTSTKHGSIIQSKVTYICGNGWATKGGAEDPAAAAFIGRLNRHGETLDEITKKATLDLEIFGGYYLQVIWSNIGNRIAEVYHIDYTRMRSNVDNTQFLYRRDWRSLRREEAKVYPAFNPANPRGSQILYVKEYRPGIDTYAIPGYIQGLDYINADVEVAKHTYGNSKNGFTPSKSITMVNGEATDDEKKKMTKRLESAWSGSGGKKFIIWFTNGAEKKPIFDDLGSSDLTKEDFSRVDDLIQTNVFSAHRITTPALFGIATPGQLGQSKELQDGYEIFKNTYVNDKQRFLERQFNLLARFADVAEPLEIQPTSPIELPFTAADVKDILPKAWVFEKLGIDISKYPADNPDAAIQQSAEGTQVNEHLKNLTGRQMQQVQRIVRQFGSGKLSREQAAMLLKSSLGMSDEDVAVWLNTDDSEQVPAQFSDEDDEKAIMLFAEYGTPRAGHVVLKSRRAKFTADTDTEVMEHAFLSFADSEITALQAAILDLISKDKYITAEALAQTIKAPLAEVTAALGTLVKSGAIEVSSKAGTEERKLTAPLKELQEGTKTKVQAYRVKYSYEGPQDSRNRPFCAKLMELDRLYTRKEIETISERLGYSVWDRRGGWYTTPGTDTHRPYCRHNWMSNVVITDGSNE